jgi:O-antigen/teichoic acid export membrane protein
LLGKFIWKSEHETQPDLLAKGWKLSAYALLAYFAYMSLTSMDLVWVNRNLNGESVGAYASLVLMRRIVALLPGVAVTVMFPRIARTLAEGRSTHRLLIQTASIILTVSGTLTILYFIFADQLITIIFGTAYQSASPLMGWMGIAMVGVSLSSIWLNYYLAERPRNFVILLGVAVALEWLLLNILPTSMQNAVLAFGATGWLLTLGGLILYWWRLLRQEVHHPRNDIETYV